ncbi:MAG: anti-sigma factor family protein [Terriglobales bacterium]
MNCKQLKDSLLDLAQTPASPTGASPAVSQDAQEHLHACPACAAELGQLRRTMSALDEWKAPEPSPYFDSRLRARLRGQATKGPGLLDFLRRPALAAAFTLLFVAGLVLFQGGQLPTTTKSGPAPPKNTIASTGAVSDLQTLDSNYDLYADFELLDELDANGTQVNQ